MKLRALIFDVDGTLAETERDGHRPAFNATFAEAGLGWHWDAALYGQLLAVTGGKERIRHYARTHDPACAERGDFDALVAKLHAAKTRRYVDQVATGALCLRPGVEALLASARAGGLRLAIATTTTAANVDALLRACLGEEASGCFELIVAGDAVAAKKPAPDVYLRCLAGLGLPAAACLAFEDSGAGLAAARAAGIATVVTPSHYSRGEDFAAALALLPDLAGIDLDQLSNLLRRRHGAVLQSAA